MPRALNPALRCPALTKAGKRCKSFGNPLCLAHDPARAEQRLKACIKGGRAKNPLNILPGVNPQTWQGIQRYKDAVLKLVARGKLRSAQARTLINIADNMRRTFLAVQRAPQTDAEEIAAAAAATTGNRTLPPASTTALARQLSTTRKVRAHGTSEGVESEQPSVVVQPGRVTAPAPTPDAPHTPLTRYELLVRAAVRGDSSPQTECDEWARRR